MAPVWYKSSLNAEALQTSLWLVSWFSDDYWRIYKRCREAEIMRASRFVRSKERKFYVIIKSLYCFDSMLMRTLYFLTDGCLHSVSLRLSLNYSSNNTHTIIITWCIVDLICLFNLCYNFDYTECRRLILVKIMVVYFTQPRGLTLCISGLPDLRTCSGQLPSTCVLCATRAVIPRGQL